MKNVGDVLRGGSKPNDITDLLLERIENADFGVRVEDFVEVGLSVDEFPLEVLLLLVHSLHQHFPLMNLQQQYCSFASSALTAHEPKTNFINTPRS